MDGKKDNFFFKFDLTLMLFRISQTSRGDKEGSFVRYSKCESEVNVMWRIGDK